MEESEHSNHENALDQKLISLSQASRLLPSKPSPSTVWRWGREGVPVGESERIHLKVWRYGRRVYTTRDALAEFGRAVADADLQRFGTAPETAPLSGSATSSARDEQRRDSAAEAAEAELAAAGA